MSIVVVELTIPTEDVKLGRILCGGTDIHVTVSRFVPLGQRTVPYFWVETDTPDVFEERVRNDDAVSTLERLVDEGGTYLYRVEWARELDGLATALRAHDLAVEEIVGTRDEWQFTLRGPNHENLSSFTDALQSRGISTTIKSLRNVDPPNRNSFGMTDKQREAVELAVRRGYFSVPRETNLSELAERLGISHQAFSRRLNRGLANVLAGTTLEDRSET